MYVFFNWDLLHARLNSHYKEWSYKKKEHIKIEKYRKSVQKEPTVKRCLSILGLKQQYVFGLPRTKIHLYPSFTSKHEF